MTKTTIAAAMGVLAIVVAGYSGVRSFAETASADDMQATIDARRTLMKDNGAKKKAMGAVVEAKAGDLAVMEQLAMGIQANAAKIPGLFPAGSSMADFPDKTFAKPKIWVNSDDFKAAAANLGTESRQACECRQERRYGRLRRAI